MQTLSNDQLNQASGGDLYDALQPSPGFNTFCGYAGTTFNAVWDNTAGFFLPTVNDENIGVLTVKTMAYSTTYAAYIGPAIAIQAIRDAVGV